jgi:hypothetical protein
MAVYTIFVAFIGCNLNSHAATLSAADLKRIRLRQHCGNDIRRR